MIHVLITGSEGQLGRSIRDISGSYPEIRADFCNRNALDITNPNQVLEYFRVTKPEYCINCASYTKVDQAELEPEKAMKVNAYGVEVLAKACKQFGTVLIHISTDYVFDGKNRTGYRPKDNPAPINVYGRSKLEGEKRIQDLLTQFFIVRTSWVYSEYPPNFFTTILNRLKNNIDLEVTDKETGCPTNAGNLSKYLLDLISSGDRRFGIRHFTDGEPMSWYDFANKIKAEYVPGSLSKITRGNNYRSFAKRPSYSILLP